MRESAVPVPDPDVAPDGVWGALLAGLAAALGGLGVWLRGRRVVKEVERAERDEFKETTAARLTAIEESLELLKRTLVVETEDGGRVAKSQKLADNLLVQIGARLNEIDARIAKRPAQLGELSRDIKSLTDAVQSGMDHMAAELRRKE